MKFLFFRTLSFFFITNLWSTGIYAQDTILWQNTIGGNSDDRVNLSSIYQTSDGGYMVGGYSYSGISGDKTEASQGDNDYWILRLDGTGSILWQNTIGGVGNDRLITIQPTNDGGCVTGGSSDSGISGDKTEDSQGDDYWIVRLDEYGNILWQNTIGGSSTDNLYSVRQTSDGGYIVGGASKSSFFSNEDYWIVRLDASGNILWQNTIGGSGMDNLYSVEQTTDGGYILGGWSDSGISGDKTEASNGFIDYWILKSDSSGNILWQKSIGGSNSDYIFSVRQTSDGGYILGGGSGSGISGDKTESSKGSMDYWILKLGTSGDLLWQKTFGGNDWDMPFYIQQTSDGGYVLGGRSSSGISGDKTEPSQGGQDYWVIRLDASGNLIGQKTLGGSGNDKLYTVQQTSDGGFILGGYSESGISGDKTEASQGLYDYWIVKLSLDSAVTGHQDAPFDSSMPFRIFPNPCSDVTFIGFPPEIQDRLYGDRITIRLFSLTGKLIETIIDNRMLASGQYTIRHNTSHLSPGVYFYSIRTGTKMYAVKLLVY